MNATVNTAAATTQTNEPAIILSEVFAAIRQNSDKSEKITGQLILGLFTHEASFDAPTLEYYFKTEAAKRRDVQTTILSVNDEKFAQEIRFLDSEKEKDKKDRNADEIETVLRRHKSLRNIFHSCMQACYFLRVGGELGGNKVGPVKALRPAKDRFTVKYVDEDGDTTTLSGKWSSAALIKSGGHAVDKLLNKQPKATTTTSVNTSPTAIVNGSVNTINTMLDVALNEVTAAMQKGGAKIERATLDDMPDDVVANIDNMLVKLLTMKFAHEGKLELIDVASWMADTMKNVTIDTSKQVRNLKKAG